jgi:catechol 2,3-dioxygenase-like lactoylglutathione lyase family enzyme
MANELAQTGNAAARSAGLHHVTAISGDIRRTHDFYTRLLGMRLVKRTVNFDDPSPRTSISATRPACPAPS